VSVMASRRSFGAILGMAAAFLPARTLAQFTEQEIVQGADVVSTGNVNIEQNGSNSGTLTVNGTPITEDGVYETSQGQVVVQNGRVVSTGNVNISQSASNDAETTIVYPTHDGEEADVCNPGAVIANPDSGRVYYQRRDCCWYAACANRCEPTGCQGNGCG
jgi:lipopolysaccharide export system protein LptA